MNNLNLKLALISSLFVVSATASAAPGTTSFDVQAKVIPNCLFTKPADVPLNDYDAVTDIDDLESSTSLTMTCTVGSTAKINLAGTASADTNYPFKMKHETGDSTLSYGLYSDAAKQTAWNATTAFEFKPESAATATKEQTIYFAVKAGQNVPVGKYTDTVTVTVAF